MVVRAWGRAWLGVALGGLLVAASCGSDSGDAGGTTAAPASEAPATEAPATEAPTTTAAPEPQTIKVGVAWADLSPFVAVNPAYGTGEPEEQALAVLDAFHRDGLLPVNGVDVEFVTKGYSAISSEERLAVCQQFGQEDKVFAAIGGRDFTEGAECLASRFNIPVVDTNQAAAADYAQAGPNFFTLKPDETSILTNFADWANGKGLLTGKKVGIYWETQAKAAVDALKESLSAAGVQVVSEVESTGQGEVGAQQDALAAQKFQADGADTVLLVVGSSSIVNFMSAADQQGYKPGYLDFDWASHLSDVAAGAYPKDQYEGTPALASVRAGDLAGGLAEPAEKCLSDYEQFSGKTIERTAPEKSGEFTNILITCDLANVLLAALTIATDGGAELTQESLVAAIEQVKDLKGAYWDTLTFAPDDHTGAATAREIKWNSACPCWEPQGDFSPLAGG